MNNTMSPVTVIYGFLLFCATLIAMNMYATQWHAKQPTEAAIERQQMHQPLASEVKSVIELYGNDQEVAQMNNWFGDECGDRKCAK